MKNKHNYKKEIISIFKELSTNYPNQSFASHMGIAFCDYPNYDNLTDKEFHFALNKYKCEKELDMFSQHSENIEDIIKQGEDLDSILNEDEDF